MLKKTSYYMLGILSLVIILNCLTKCTNRGNSGAKDSVIKNSFLNKNKFSDTARISRGHYLVVIGGCNDCHSPKKFTPQGTLLDSGKLLSGHPSQPAIPPVDARGFKLGYWMLFSPDLTAYIGNWGISFAANITPDSTTGIGAWKEADFVGAIRTGKHIGQPAGRPILPPMPWAKFAKMTDEDLKSIYAYLRTVPAIHNEVPHAVLPKIQSKNN